MKLVIVSMIIIIPIMSTIKLVWTAFFVATVISTVVPRVSPIESHVPLAYKVQIDDAP